MFPWGKTTEERMISEVGSEMENYRGRLEALHEEFQKKLRIRDEARATLAESDEHVKSLQKEGLSLLGNLNAASSESEDERVKELESNSKRNTRELIRAQQRRERLAQKLKTVEVDDEEAVRELKEAASNVLDKYARRIQKRKKWLSGVAETLDSQRETLAREASPLTGEYGTKKPEELPAAENAPEDE